MKEEKKQTSCGFIQEMEEIALQVNGDIRTPSILKQIFVVYVYVTVFKALKSVSVSAGNRSLSATVFLKCKDLEI